MKSFTQTLFLFLGISLLLIQCKSESEFSIEGNFLRSDPTPVKLFLLSDESALLIDSTYVSDQDFNLAGNILYPGIYLLKFFNDQSIYLVVHPGDNIKVQIDNVSNTLSYHVDKSPDSKLIKELSDRQNLVLRQIDELSNEWGGHIGDSAMRRRIDSTYHTLLRNHKKFSEDFIYAHPKSIANIMVLYQNFGRKNQTLFDPYDDLDVFDYVDSNLVMLYPKTDAVQALNREVNSIKSQIEERKYIEKVVEVGQLLPPFNYVDIHNDTIQFGEGTGKAVLMLFWASWNPFSVEELLNLNRIWQQLDSHTIKIVSVALDSSKDELLKFIQQHNIQVPVVCDYDYWDSEIAGRYSVKRIPSNLLSNKEGVIIAKDIFSNELITRLNEGNK